MYRFKKKEKAENCIYYTDKIRHNLKKEKWQSFSALSTENPNPKPQNKTATPNPNQKAKNRKKY